jgi:phosphatidylserine/phosphatidylglycerophosphate/cardiolipin synthase-like enzyme
MTKRAREGVRVNVLLDAFGSAGATRAFFRPLIEAGGKVEWYNSPAWHRLTHLDNRTHRELLIVDGEIGFIGGACLPARDEGQGSRRPLQSDDDGVLEVRHDACSLKLRSVSSIYRRHIGCEMRDAQLLRFG